jgi:hypothetical protein
MRICLIYRVLLIICVNTEFISPSRYHQLVIHTYTSVSNAILFFIYSSSLLHVSAVLGHHQATVYLAKTVTLHFTTVFKMN